LMSAFQAGFQGHEIEATGPKSDSFLEILVLHECLISIDSIQELTRLSNIIEKIQPSKKINIGLRLGKVTLPSRDLKYVLSRFGITDVDFHSALEIIKNNSSLNLKAIHFHSGRLSFGEKVSLLPAICSLVKVALSEGFLIEELNLGGGFRNDLLENNTDWDQYLDSIEEQLLNGEGVNSWSGSNYGLQLNQTGTISGRGIALSKGEPENYESSLNSLLSKKIDEYYTLAAFLDELDITLAIEPGYFLLDQAGMSFFKVIEAKESLSGHNFVVVGGNYYDLASHVREYIPDPIHLPRNKISGAPFTAYISGNLCREDDVLINRAIIFQRKPEPGDLLCFTNTAAYKSDFENISAHMRKPTADFEAAWLSPTGIWNLRTANKLSHLEIKNILIN